MDSTQYLVLDLNYNHAIEEVAKANADTHFVIIDSVVEDQDNVASVLFKDHEAKILRRYRGSLTQQNLKNWFRWWTRRRRYWTF